MNRLNRAELRDRINGSPNYGSVDSRFWPAKTTTRGFFYCEELDLHLDFQFNPTEITVDKKQIYTNRQYTGRMHAEPIWINGEVRNISFNLTFDATASSANEKIGLFDPTSGKFGSEVRLSSHINSIDSQLEEMSVKASRGTLDIIERLESFSYPMLSDPKKPRFTNGVAILDPQGKFLPPPTVTFVFGLWAMETKLSMSYNHVLFDKNLIPTRTEVKIDLNVLEGIVVNLAQ